MNEVSFRNDILEAIDEIVTESSTDVLFSMLDASEKAMVILENCTDEDDIWKYSVWQEADENKGEEIDKDKHPFKESSTLKTILMLPINLIRFIFKTISQALSPQKAEESSKLAAAAGKAKNVFQKVAPFLFKEEGELNLPVVIGISATGATLTLDGILRQQRSILAAALRKIDQAWNVLKGKLGRLGVKDVPDKITFTPDKKNEDTFYVSIDFDKVIKYIDEMGKLMTEIPTKIDEIEKATDEKVKNTKSDELRKRVYGVINLCPVSKDLKSYDAGKIASYYTQISQKTNAFANVDAKQFDEKYKSVVEKVKSKAAAKAASHTGTALEMYNKILEIIAGIKEANDAVTKAISDAAAGLHATGEEEITVTEGEQPETPSQEEYEEVTITDGKAPDGFPNDYFTKGADGKYSPVPAGTTQPDPNTTYYKKKNEAAPANDNAGADNPTDTTGGASPAETGANNSDDTSPAGDVDDTAINPTDTSVGQASISPNVALGLFKNMGRNDIRLEAGVLKDKNGITLSGTFSGGPKFKKAAGEYKPDAKQLNVVIRDGRQIIYVEYFTDEDDTPIDPVVSAWYSK